MLKINDIGRIGRIGQVFSTFTAFTRAISVNDFIRPNPSYPSYRHGSKPMITPATKLNRSKEHWHG